LENTIRRCRERDIVIPTYKERVHPEKILQGIKDDLRNIALCDLHSRNLFAILLKQWEGQTLTACCPKPFFQRDGHQEIDFESKECLAALLRGCRFCDINDSMSEHILKRHNKSLVLYYIVCPAKYRQKAFTQRL